LLVDVPELGNAIDVIAAFQNFGICLQALIERAQKIADKRFADVVAHFLQLGRQVAQALGRPQQRLHRIATRIRLDQSFQVVEQGRILRNLRLAPRAGSSRAPLAGREPLPDFRNPPDRKSTRLNSSHNPASRMPSSA
jgi:hypothetical protein